VKQGKSVDTTMGLTPLEGLLAGTHNGDVDPSQHLFFHQKKSLSLEEVTDLLTRKSGLLGMSGVSHDMRPWSKPSNRVTIKPGSRSISFVTLSRV
jgi:acetate kinase